MSPAVRRRGADVLLFADASVTSPRDCVAYVSYLASEAASDALALLSKLAASGVPTYMRMPSTSAHAGYMEQADAARQALERCKVQKRATARRSTTKRSSKVLLGQV
jgi:hypothetical protein